jgi:hypothetical protein
MRIPSSTPVLLAAAALAALVPGCAGDPGESAPDTSAVVLPSPSRGPVLEEFIGHVSPKNGTLTFERVKPSATVPGFKTQDLSASGDSLTLDNDGVAGSGSNNTVELVTNSVGWNNQCPPGYQSNSFCGNVTLRHFYTRPFSHVHVEITDIKVAGAVNYTHSALNSDDASDGLNGTFGLWEYTAPAATTPGVVGASPNNVATRDWVFANPDDADFSIKIRVVAAVSYSAYMLDYSSQSFVDACSGGTNLGQTASTTQTMPFAFTLYSATSSTARFNKRAMITFGTVSGTATGSNVNLPNGLAPKPGLYVFWDDITYGAAPSATCYKVLGSAPNRQYVVTWKQMDFSLAPDKGSSLTFSAFLSEGTNLIDLVYDTMNGPTSRKDGDSATVGVQNASANTATAEFNTPDFGSGNAYSLVPIP